MPPVSCPLVAQLREAWHELFVQRPHEGRLQRALQDLQLSEPISVPRTGVDPQADVPKPQAKAQLVCLCGKLLVAVECTGNGRKDLNQAHQKTFQSQKYPAEPLQCRRMYIDRRTRGATPLMSPDAPSRDATARSNAAAPSCRCAKPNCMRTTSVGCVSTVAATAATVPDAKLTAVDDLPSCTAGARAGSACQQRFRGWPYGGYHFCAATNLECWKDAMFGTQVGEVETITVSCAYLG